VMRRSRTITFRLWETGESSAAFTFFGKKAVPQESIPFLVELRVAPPRVDAYATST
jgi:hypothetical protein